MPLMFVALLKINLVLTLFALTYYLVLRKLTFYFLNRIFLLFGIVFSTVYPFINLTEIFYKHDGLPAFVPGLKENVGQLVQLESVSLMWQILTVVFYLGTLFMALRLAIQFISLNRVHRKSNPGMIDNYKVRILNEKISPFSFWKNIYVNPELHKVQDLNNIIEHEKIHVEELHTLDIILAEISLVFYWFNPGVWLMKKAVKENIEFITDAKILKKGVDRKAYQYSLLDVGTLQNPVKIINNFNLSDLKKRIKMMNVKRSSKVNLTRYMFVLPVILCVSLAFTIDKKDIEERIISVKNVLNENETINNTVALEPSVSKLKKAQLATANQKQKIKKDRSLTVVNILRAPSTFGDSIQLVSTDNHKKVDVIVQKEIDEAKSHWSFAGIFLSSDDTSKDDKYNKPVDVTVIGYGLKSISQSKIIRFRGVPADSIKRSTDGSFIINGEIVDREKLNSIDPNTIKTITVVGRPRIK